MQVYSDFNHLLLFQSAAARQNNFSLTPHQVIRTPDDLTLLAYARAMKSLAAEPKVIVRADSLVWDIW
jgi:hypothetical protein